MGGRDGDHGAVGSADVPRHIARRRPPWMIRRRAWCPRFWSPVAFITMSLTPYGTQQREDTCPPAVVYSVRTCGRLAAPGPRLARVCPPGTRACAPLQGRGRRGRFARVWGSPPAMDSGHGCQPREGGPGIRRCAAPRWSGARRRGAGRPALPVRRPTDVGDTAGFQAGDPLPG